jgi:hypothetical protein
MITFYHGSDMEVQQPLAKAGRRNLDFGQGFISQTSRNKPKPGLPSSQAGKVEMSNPL